MTMADRTRNLARFKPGMYRGGSDPQFGLWRLRQDGVWLFCVPVVGQVWDVAKDQSGDHLRPLM